MAITYLSIALIVVLIMAIRKLKSLANAEIQKFEKEK